MSCPRNSMEITAPLTLEQVFVGQWHNCFHLPHDSNDHTQMVANIFFDSDNIGAGLEVITALVRSY